MAFRYLYDMRALMCLLVLAIVFSCQEKVEEPLPLIEIYELNKWVESYEAEPLDSTMIKSFQEYEMDTTRVRFNKEFGILINGAFHTTTSDLKDTPLISHKEIKGFDFKEDIIVIDTSTIKNLFPKTHFQKARQLALTIDRKVILSFYERNSFSSYEIGNAVFFDDYNTSFTEETFAYSHYLKLGKGPFLNNEWWKNNPNLKQDTTFYNAFKRAGKIIDE